MEGLLEQVIGAGGKQLAGVTLARRRRHDNDGHRGCLSTKAEGLDGVEDQVRGLNQDETRRLGRGGHGACEQQGQGLHGEFGDQRLAQVGGRIGARFQDQYPAQRLALAAGGGNVPQRLELLTGVAQLAVV